jgi:hypothetical protein
VTGSIFAAEGQEDVRKERIPVVQAPHVAEKLKSLSFRTRSCEWGIPLFLNLNRRGFLASLGMTGKESFFTACKDCATPLRL